MIKTNKKKDWMKDEHIIEENTAGTLKWRKKIIKSKWFWGEQEEKLSG